MRKICSAEGHDILRCPIGRRSAQSRLGCFHTPKSSSGIPLQMDSPVKTSFEGITPVKSDALQFPEVRALLGSVGSFRAMLARLSGLIVVCFGRFWILQTTSEVFTGISPDNSLERLTECGVGLVTDQSSDFWEPFVTRFK